MVVVVVDAGFDRLANGLRTVEMSEIYGALSKTFDLCHLSEDVLAKLLHEKHFRIGDADHLDSWLLHEAEPVESDVESVENVFGARQLWHVMPTKKARGCTNHGVSRTPTRVVASTLFVVFFTPSLVR